MPQLKPRTLRVSVNLPVVVEHGTARIQAVAVNLGLGGVFIQADSTLPYGEQLNVVVQLPGLAAPSRLPAVVRWSDQGGFGVQFQQLGARETHAIGAMVAAYRQAELVASEGKLPGSPSTAPP